MILRPRSIPIYLAMSHRNHAKTPGENNFNVNPQPRCGLLLQYLVLAPSLYPLLGLSPSGFFVVFLFSWTRHLVMDSTYHQQTATLSPHDSVSYLSACLFSIHFYIFLLLSWYSLAVTRYLVYCCYWRSRALFLVQYLVAEREIVDVV